MFASAVAENSCGRNLFWPNPESTKIEMLIKHLNFELCLRRRMMNLMSNLTNQFGYLSLSKYSKMMSPNERQYWNVFPSRSHFQNRSRTYPQLNYRLQ